MRILIAEDSKTLAQWLARALEDEGYEVECAYDGVQADQRLLTEVYDLVILDLSLPRMHGREVLSRLRGRPNFVPVLILSANNSIEGRVAGLDIGADDYLGKPFELVELEARMRALLRRAGQHKDPNVMMRCGSLAFDTATLLFHVGRTPLALTPREHAVLEALISKVGKTVSKRSLAARLCSVDEHVSPEAIEIYIHRVRKKLEASDASIITLRGLGYLLKQRGAA